MATILHIAGHGKQPNGSFDPGATGYITQGEHRYFANSFFKAMQKFLPTKHNMVFHTAYDVFAYGNIASLARQYGNDTIIVEWHFDASGSPQATGGHIIVYGGYQPNKLDLALRDVIERHIGVRYSHQGHQGVSGRYDLANANRSAHAGIDYRMAELGFGTSPKDSTIMINNIEAIAKDMVHVLVGEVVDVKTETVNVPAQKKVVKKLADYTNEQLATFVLSGEFGNGAERRKALGARYNAVQALIDKQLTGTTSPKLSVTQVARDVLAGKYGNGAQRKTNLERAGYNFNAVQAEVNRLLGVGNIKSVDALAREVIAGEWSTGQTRRNRLIGAGYDYNAIQRRVNQLI